MAQSDRGQAVLSSEYGEDVSLVLSSTHICSSCDGLGSFRFVSGVSLGRLGAKEIHSAGHGKEVFGLFSGLVRSEYSRGETPQLGTTFINQFMRVRGDFPVDFRPLGWVHSSNRSWWGKMVGFVLVKLGALLEQVRLYHSIRLCSMASRKAPIISMASWSTIIL